MPVALEQLADTAPLVESAGAAELTDGQAGQVAAVDAKRPKLVPSAVGSRIAEPSARMGPVSPIDPSTPSGQRRVCTKPPAPKRKGKSDAREAHGGVRRPTGQRIDRGEAQRVYGWADKGAPHGRDRCRARGLPPRQVYWHIERARRCPPLCPAHTHPRSPSRPHSLGPHPYLPTGSGRAGDIRRALHFPFQRPTCRPDKAPKAARPGGKSLAARVTKQQRTTNNGYDTTTAPRLRGNSPELCKIFCRVITLHGFQVSTLQGCPFAFAYCRVGAWSGCHRPEVPPRSAEGFPPSR